MKILADENIHIGITNELRNAGIEIVFISEVGLVSGDKDFGGLIEFGTLWGRGKVILLRYRLINTSRIAKNIAEAMNKEKELFNTEKSFVIVFSESGYRIHRHQD